MLSVYDTQATNLLRELHGKSVLVRDDQTVAPGLEVRQYYGYSLYTRSPIQYVPSTSTALEMLYIKEGENIPVCEIVAFLLPTKFPKTYDFLMQKDSERILSMRFYRTLANLTKQKSFVEKTGPGKYAIIEEVREKQILPDCLSKS